MIFLSLFLDLLWMFSGTGAYATADGAVGQVDPPGEHRTHGHLPGPPDGHDGDSHLHHGQHGHTVSSAVAGGNHQAPPHHF